MMPMRQGFSERIVFAIQEKQSYLTTSASVVMAVYIVIGRVAKNHNRKQTVIGLLFLYMKSYTRTPCLR